MKTLILYRQIRPGVDCPDGIVAAHIAAMWCDRNHKEWEQQGHTIGSAKPIVENYGDIIVVDLSFPSKTLKKWKEKHPLKVYDHRHSAKKNFIGIADGVDIVYDTSECASTLTWRHLMKCPPPALLKIIKDKSLWRFNYHFTKPIHKAISRLGWDYDTIKELLRLDERTLVFTLNPLGKWLLEIEASNIKKALERVEWKPVNTVTAPTILLTEKEVPLTNQILEALSKRFPTAPFVACVVPSGTTHIRSNKKDRKKI